MEDKTAPKSHLELEWVYGYRGHQCRNNLFYTHAQNVVYFVAGVGVVYDVTARKQRFFIGHTDDIISLALHPEKQLVATGQIGKDPFICIWDTDTCQTLSILKEVHERGITCLSFSSSGQHLASVGLEDHATLCVWDWKKGKSISTTRGHSDRIFDVKFNPYNNNELTTCGVKHIKFWTLCGNALTAKKGTFGQVGEIQTLLCVGYGSNDVIYAGTLSGDICKWHQHKLISTVPSAHKGGVFTMDTTPDGYATGSKDGTAALWDPEFNLITRIDLGNNPMGYHGLSIRSVCWNGEKILAGTNGGEIFEVVAGEKDKPVTIIQGHAEGELWALAVHPKKEIFVTGSDDKTVRLWDMASTSMIAKVHFDLEVRSAAFSTDGTQICVGHSNGSFRVLKGRDLSELMQIQDRKEVLHEMKYSPDGSWLAVGSNDNFVDIYSVHDKYKRVGQCKGSSSFITHFDWSTDSKYLQTNSGASERLFYKMPSGKRLTKAEEIELIQWHSWTCVLGTEVNGIWEKYAHTDDINAADANFSKGVIATGDDFGFVKLLKFPSTKKGAKFKKYIGHSAHVTNVRFSCRGSRLITTGGADRAIFQWHLTTMSSGMSPREGVAPQTGSIAHHDSHDEATDSDLSEVDALDSDIEQEANHDYQRPIYKEDLQVIQKKLKEQEISNDATVATRKARPKAPSKGIQLDFIFGYRGYDCRNNLFYTQSGDIVYHVSAVGVIYNPTASRQRFYLGHDDDILALTIHPVKDLVATGQVGRDPAIHIWSMNTLAAVSVLKGQHERGICALDFSTDGKRLASVGLDDNHCVVIWDWRRGEKLASTRGHKDKIFEVKWDPFSQDELITVGMKHIKFWTKAGGGFTSKRGTFGDVGKPETMLCATYTKTEGVVYSGAANGMVYMWDKAILKSAIQAHQGPVFALKSLEKGFVTGGKDGVVSLWDETFSRCLKSYRLSNASVEKGQHGATLLTDNPPVRSVCLGNGKILVGTKNSEILEIEKAGPINILMQGHCEGEVWGLSQHPHELVCATASDDGSLRLWDMEQKCMVKSKSLGQPARCVAFSPDGKAIAVGMKNGSFKAFNASTLEEIIGFHHRKAEISDVKFSPGEGKYLAVGSHENFVDIYNVLQRNRVGICKGASSYITHIDWTEAGKLLQINSGAREVLYFEAPRGKRQVVSTTEVENLNWATWTAVLGDQCEGIWAPGSDITDINSADLSKDKTLLATGDDFGFVKLFHFPVKGKHAKCRKYNGHSAHVTNVRWSHDDSRLTTVGGADTSVMIWTHVAKGTANEAASNTACEESETDSEEESGFDSDVEREKSIDYTQKTYTTNTRDMDSIRPTSQPQQKRPMSKVTRNARKSSVKLSAHSASSPGTHGTAIETLSLDVIHGYRGFDTRNNLHYCSNGDIVYHAAGAGIVMSSDTKIQSFYLEHTDDIICLTVNQNPKFKNVIASGQVGVDPTVRIWDSMSKQTLSVLRGYHSKGICAVDFSSSGRYLLSVGVGDDHSVAVWRWSEGTKMACSKGPSHRIFVGEFRPQSDTSFVTCGVKHVMFWEVTGGSLVGKRGSLESVDNVKMQTMLSVAFGQDNITFTGAMSGDVFVWSRTSLARIVGQAHSGPIFSMSTTLKDGLIVIGGKDKTGKNGGVVKVWDQEMKRCRTYQIKGRQTNPTIKAVCRGGQKNTLLIGTSNGEVIEINEKTSSQQVLVQGHGEGEIWAAVTHPEKDLFYTGSDDCTLRIWDLISKTMKESIAMDAGVRSIAISSSGDLLCVGLKNGELVLYNSASLQVLGRKRDRSAMVNSVRFSPDGSVLAVGTQDKSLDFYDCRPGGALPRLGYCKGIPSFVISMDFSSDGKYLQVDTGSYERLIFTVPDGTHITNQTAIDGIKWHSWSSTTGKEVLGIWPKDSKKGDINCAALSHSGSTLATGDHFGYVRLFPFPCLEKHMKGNKFIGHSAHVTNVRFSHNDSFLVSTGGDDSCVFVWRCD